MREDKNFLRKSYRLQIPARVFIEGKEYEVVDWSFLGFRIKKEKYVNFDGDKSYTVSFELPFASFNLNFLAKAVRRWESDEFAGFEFVELSDEVKLLMKDYVMAYVEGRLTSADGFIVSTSGLELPVDVEPKITEEERKLLDKKLKRNTLIILLVFIVAIFLIYQIYENMPIVYSTRAFVSGNTINVLAPYEGEVEEINVKPGDSVKQGSVIVRIKNQEIDTEYNLLKNLYLEKKKALSKLNSYSNLIKQSTNMDDYSKLKELELSISLTKAELEQKKSRRNMLSVAYDMSFIKREELDRVEQEIATLESKLALLLAKKREMERYKQYRYTSSSLTGVFTKELDIEGELATIGEKLNSLEIKRKMGEILSPVDAYVLSINKNRGERVKYSEPIVVLEAFGDSKYVIASFKLEDAMKIKAGNEVEVYFPSIGKIYNGKVVSVGKSSLSSDSLVSETESYALLDVPVKIALDNGDKNLHHGLLAEVKVKTHSRYVFVVEFISKLLGR